MALLGIAGLATLFFFAHRWIKESTSRDPVVVREATTRMADIDVPPGLAPSASFAPTVPFGKGRLLNLVIYTDPASHSDLMLMSMGALANPQNEEQAQRQMVQQQMDQALRQQGQAPNRDLHINQSHTKDIKIGDQTAKFTFSTGRSPKGNQNRILVQGTFQGKNGIVMLMFSGDADKYNEAALTKMLESIKVK